SLIALRAFLKWNTFPSANQPLPIRAKSLTIASPIICWYSSNLWRTSIFMKHIPTIPRLQNNIANTGPASKFEIVSSVRRYYLHIIEFFATITTITVHARIAISVILVIGCTNFSKNRNDAVYSNRFAVVQNYKHALTWAILHA